MYMLVNNIIIMFADRSGTAASVSCLTLLHIIIIIMGQIIHTIVHHYIGHYLCTLFTATCF